MYIIAEYLFIENFIINYTILQSTKIITRTKVGRGRIFIAAIIAAFYPFILFIPSIVFFANFYMKIIISIFIVKLAYNSKSAALFLKQLSAFYIISFIFAGASIGTYYLINSYNNIFFKSKGFEEGFPVKYVVLGVVLGGIMIKNIISYNQEKISREQELLEITVHLNEYRSSFVALTDTGNSLVEPISKFPVLVVEYKMIKDLLPLILRQVFDNHQENDFIILENVIKKLRGEMKIRFIPFKSIGSNDGLLIGFKPDYIKVSNCSSEAIYKDLMIGIFNDKLSVDEQYNGLLNLEILNRGNICVDEN